MADNGIRISTADNDSQWKEEIRGHIIVTKQGSAARDLFLEDVSRLWFTEVGIITTVLFGPWCSLIGAFAAFVAWRLYRWYAARPESKDTKLKRLRRELEK